MSPQPPPSPSTTSTSTTRNRNNGTATPLDLSDTTRIRRSASVSKSLGAPERIKHLALFSKIAKPSFDPYSIFLTPHYSDKDLARHRSWSRLLPQNYKVPLYVLLYYWPPLCATAAVSVAVALYETYGVPASTRLKSVARSELAVPFQLTSFCLSILLVFRTTASYERWNEARKIWGSVAVETRTVARELRCFVERSEGAKGEGGDVVDEGDPERERTRRSLAEILSWCAAAPIALKAAVATTVDGTSLLRGVGRCVAEGGGFEAVLTDKQRRGLWRSTGGRPLLAPPCVFDRISRGLASLPQRVLSDILLATIGQRVAAMGALASSADRLKRQPIPPAYTRNTARFLAIWLFFLPLALWNPLRWWSIPACIIISFLLVAVENVGSQLESPHPLLPVDELVSIAVNGVRDAGGKWYLDPHERTSFGGESGSDDDGGESDCDDDGSVAVAAPPPTTENV